MRALLIGAMSATLIGCSCLKPAPLKPDRTTTKIKYTTAAKTSKPSTSQPGNQNGLVEKHSPAMTPAIPSSTETSDPVLTKAKTTTAATLENPASAEFDGMKRAVRKDTMGQPIDTICGYVKGKKASGEETGERPFLYL